MEGELFLFEVLVDAITFEESIREIPPKKQIVVTVKLGSLVTLEIRSETLPLAAESSKRRNIDLKSGKSYLCFMMAPALIELLEKDRIEITVGTRGSLQPIGGSVASWDPCFKEMVRTCLEATDFVSPVTTFEHFCLLDNGAIKGSIDIFLKLSCFANNIQTQFELLQEGDTKKFLFKVPNTATTFMCSKFGTGTSLDFTPIAPIMNADNIRLETHDKPRASVSWTTVLGHSSNFTVNRKNSQQSECLYPEFQTAGHGQIKTSVMTFDIQSIRIRPDEEKFMDFFTGKKWGDWDIQTMSLIDNEGNEAVIVYTDDEMKFGEQGSSVDGKGPHIKLSKACQCPKTPTVCKHVLDAIRIYEKSHPDLMIHGKKVKYEKLLREEESNSSDSILRLKGGNDDDKEPEETENQKDDEDKEEAGATDENLEKPGTDETEGENLEAEEKVEENEETEELMADEKSKESMKEQTEDETDQKVANEEGVTKSEKIEEAPTKTSDTQDTTNERTELPERDTKSKTEDIYDYIHKKGKGCYNPKCPMGKRLRSVGLSQLTEYSQYQKDMKYYCEEFYCPESVKKNTPLTVRFSEDPLPFTYKCKNKYCPAAKKFKELGLGPLATEKCQGTLYGPVKPPVEYGISQTYGTFDTYGPYGIFSQTETPFLPNDDQNEKNRGVLRLRGGGTSIVAYNKNQRLRAGSPSKSPIAECQEVMEQFDKILEEYRRTLESGRQDAFSNLEQYMERSTTANCGHPRCTYISEPALPPIHWDCPDPLPKGICENPNCPYLPHDLRRITKILEEKAKQNSNKTRCPCQAEQDASHTLYSDFKSAPEFSHRSNDKSLTYSGLGTCPFYNPPKTINMLQYGANYPPCMQKSSSFIDSEMCSNTDCPVRNVQQICSNPSCPVVDKDFKQTSPDFNCSVSRLSITKPCSNPNCPLKHRKSVSETCKNPECPYQKQSFSGSTSCPDSSVNEPCSNPNCPFKEVQEQHSEQLPEKACFNGECYNPVCPFRKLEKPVFVCDETGECRCSNPNCPAKHRCSNLDCPFNLEAQEICGNPKCPYKSRQSAKNKGVCREDICGDNTCPFSEAIDLKSKEEQEEETNQLQVAEGRLETDSDTRNSNYEMTPCHTKTCKYMGGKYKCVDCAILTEGRTLGPCPKVCGGDFLCPLVRHPIFKKMKVQSPEVIKRKMRKERSKFVYHIGDDYPNKQAGHKECVVPQYIVPSKMGWLWNIYTPCLSLKQRKGWRPGLLGKKMLEIVQAHRKKKNMPPFEQQKKRKRTKYGRIESETEIIDPKPTLQIKRREGIYYITMNPLKDPRTLVPKENPYMDCTPVQFKIAKNKDNEIKTCICNDQGVISEPLSSSSDSELDIEFTPPAGLIHPERFTKTKNVVHVDTQYLTKDFIVDVEKDKKKDHHAKAKGAEEAGDKGKGKGKEKVPPEKGKGKDTKALDKSKTAKPTDKDQKGSEKDKNKGAKPPVKGNEAKPTDKNKDPKSLSKDKAQPNKPGDKLKTTGNNSVKDTKSAKDIKPAKDTKPQTKTVKSAQDIKSAKDTRPAAKDLRPADKGKDAKTATGDKNNAKVVSKEKNKESKEKISKK